MSQFLKRLVVDHVEAAIRHQTFWHTDAFRSLVVFEDGSQDTWQSQCRTVQGVAEFGLLVLSTAVAAFQTVGLIGVEVRYGANLQPAFLCLAVYLEVVRHRRDAGCGRGVRVSGASLPRGRAFPDETALSAPACRCVRSQS